MQKTPDTAVRPQRNLIEEKTLQRNAFVIGSRYPADIESNAAPIYSHKSCGRAPIWSTR